MVTGMNGWLGMLAFAGGAFLLTVALTGVVYRYALKKDLLDWPNDRSSHRKPTPRGGGLAIVIVLVGTVSIATLWVRQFPIAMGMTVALGGGVLAVTNFVDDHGHVRAPIRMGAQLVAAAWAVYWIGPLREIDFGIATLGLGVLGPLVTVLGIVGFANLYNFMDGADGLAGGEAISCGGFLGAMLVAEGKPELGWFGIMLAATAGGFLVWNWPPAKIFMGDVGSGPLGYWFAVLAVASANAGGPGILVWLLVFEVFVFDGMVTLVRRMLRGYKWYRPHRNHAYQRAIQAGFSHRAVSSGVLAINGLLIVLATASVHWPIALLPSVLFATGVLSIVYVKVETLVPLYEAIPGNPPSGTSTVR